MTRINGTLFIRRHAATYKSAYNGRHCQRQHNPRQLDWATTKEGVETCARWSTCSAQDHILLHFPTSTPWTVPHLMCDHSKSFTHPNGCSQLLWRLPVKGIRRDVPVRTRRGCVWCTLLTARLLAHTGTGTHPRRAAPRRAGCWAQTWGRISCWPEMCPILHTLSSGKHGHGAAPATPAAATERRRHPAAAVICFQRNKWPRLLSHAENPNFY